MPDKKTTISHKQDEIDRTRIKGYSIRAGAFNSWLHESGYSKRQIAARLNMKEDAFIRKLKEKQLFGKNEWRILVNLMGAPSACFVMYFPTFELRRQIYFEVFGKELPLQKNRERRRNKK